MPIPKELPPFIAFHFEGVVALRIAKDTHTFEAGIIKPKDSDDEIEDHVHSIKLTTRVNGTSMQPLKIVEQGKRVKLVTLKIDDPAHPSGAGIRFHEEPIGPDFNRGAAFDYRWALDVEGKEMNDDKPVVIKKKSLRTVLQVDGIARGTFFTGHSGRGLTIVKNEASGQSIFLRTAESLKVLIPLAADARLSWLDEGVGVQQEILLRRALDTSYEIEVMNNCTTHPCKVDVAPHYNNLFESQGPKKFKFSGTAEALSDTLLDVPFTPETICTPPNFSVAPSLPIPD